MKERMNCSLSHSLGQIYCLTVWNFCATFVRRKAHSISWPLLRGYITPSEKWWPCMCISVYVCVCEVGPARGSRTRTRVSAVSVCSNSDVSFLLMLSVNVCVCVCANVEKRSQFSTPYLHRIIRSTTRWLFLSITRAPPISICVISFSRSHPSPQSHCAGLSVCVVWLCLSMCACLRLCVPVCRHFIFPQNV